MFDCAIYTHTPARKSSTDFQLYYSVIQICSTNWVGHGHGYKWHSSEEKKAEGRKMILTMLVIIIRRTIICSSILNIKQ